MAHEDWDRLVENKNKTDKNSYLLIDIVLYGPKENRSDVGKLLSTARTYLQHPCYQEAGTSYDNPHFLKLEALVPSSQPMQTSTPPLTTTQNDFNVFEFINMPAEEEPSPSQICRKVATVLNSLTRSKNLKRIEADIRIKTKLLP